MATRWHTRCWYWTGGLPVCEHRPGYSGKVKGDGFALLLTQDDVTQIEWLTAWVLNCLLWVWGCTIYQDFCPIVTIAVYIPPLLEMVWHHTLGFKGTYSISPGKKVPSLFTPSSIGPLPMNGRRILNNPNTTHYEDHWKASSNTPQAKGRTPLILFNFLSRPLWAWKMSFCSHSTDNWTRQTRKWAMT